MFFISRAIKDLRADVAKVEAEADVRIRALEAEAVSVDDLLRAHASQAVALANLVEQLVTVLAPTAAPEVKALIATATAVAAEAQRIFNKIEHK